MLIVRLYVCECVKKYMNYLAYRPRDVIDFQIGCVNSPSPSPRYVCVTLYDKMSLAAREAVQSGNTSVQKFLQERTSNNRKKQFKKKCEKEDKIKRKKNNKKKHFHYFRSSSIPTHPLLSTKRETTMLSLQNQRQPKTTPLVDEYEISDTVLGLGINGKVVQCINRRTKQNFALKVLLDNEKARREVDLHWRVSGCKHIVNIIDVYENTYSGRKCLLVVMEW